LNWNYPSESYCKFKLKFLFIFVDDDVISWIGIGSFFCRKKHKKNSRFCRRGLKTCFCPHPENTRQSPNILVISTLSIHLSIFRVHIGLYSEHTQLLVKKHQFLKSRSASWFKSINLVCIFVFFKLLKS
jgi:hypothetical protein